MHAIRVRRRARWGPAFVALLLAAAGCTDNDDQGTSRPSTPTTVSTTTARPAQVLQLGRELPATDLGGPLPEEGVAIDVTDVGTVLVALDGRVVGHLPKLSIWPYEDAGPGPFFLRAQGEDYRLDPGARALVPLPHSDETHFPLAYGTELVSLDNLAPGDNWLERDGRRVLELGNRMSDEEDFAVSADRDIVSFRRSRALDLRTGQQRAVPDACDVADRHGKAWYLRCRREGTEPAIEVGPGDGTWRQVVGSVEPAAQGVYSGHWERAFVSPDGTRLLAEWSTECEVAHVFLMDVDGGHRQALAAAFGLDDPDLFAQAWGWTKDGRAIVSVQGQPGCASDQPVSGVYVLGRGAPALLYAVDDWARVNGIAVWAPLLRS